MTDLQMVYRLLNWALIEIRDDGYNNNRKLVFHLSDLFHSVHGAMVDAAEGKCSYSDVIAALKTKAAERGSERWLQATMSHVESLGQHPRGPDGDGKTEL